MAVKIRLQRKGRKQRPFYHIVVADARSPRDGRFIERIGTYNPMTKPATIDLDRDRAFTWLMDGAQPTDTARAILRFKGVMYKKHLHRGVQKGALTQEEADVKWQEWIDVKEAKVAARVAKAAEELADFHAMVSGTPPPPPPPEVIPSVEVAEVAAEEVAEEATEAVAETTEAVAETTEAAAEAATEAVETAAETVEPAAEVAEETTTETEEEK